MAEAAPIELSEEVSAWLDVRKDILNARSNWYALSSEKTGAAGEPVLPYEAQAATKLGLLSGEELDVGYPVTDKSTEDLLDALREKEAVTAKKAIALTRQIALAESFKKQLIARRSRRMHCIMHQYDAVEVNRSQNDALLRLQLVSETIR